MDMSYIGNPSDIPIYILLALVVAWKDQSLPSPQLIDCPLDIRPRSRRLNEFTWFRRRLVPDTYRPAGLIRRSECRFAIQHLPRPHMP
jgi:hypothetical protein